VDPRPWFRCPFGAGHDDPRILATLGRLGYQEVPWDVEAEDWDPALDPREVASIIVERTVAVGDGAVVLLHTWPESTGDAIGPIVAALRERGATFVGVDELRPATFRPA
jgi:peptidoglycan/xylan/chitin deacetylase (PgdA/CDA1 family)